MSELMLPALSLLLGMVSGFIAGLATGGGMISIPALIFMGLSPTTAIATTSLVGFSGFASSFKYYKTKLVAPKQALPFVVIALLGGIIGAGLLHHVNGQLMQKVFGTVCLIMSLAIWTGKNVSGKSRTKKRDLIGVILTFIASIVTVLVGTGGGIFMLYIFTYFYGMSVLEANATTKFMSLGGVPSSIIVFAHAGMINYSVGIPLAMGSLIGGYVGAHTAVKKGDDRVKAVLVGVAVISGLKLLLS